jgi:hypothetical protein
MLDIILRSIDRINNEWMLFSISILGMLSIIGIVKGNGKLIVFVKRILKIRSVQDLKHHYVFSTLPLALQDVKSRTYYTHGKFDHVKTRMCYDFTKHKVEVCAKHMLNFLDIENLDTMGKDKLKNKIINLQNQIHTEYVKDITNDWLGRGIPKNNVLYVVDLFERFRAPVLDRFSYQIEQIFATELNQNNFERIKDVYDMWSGGIKDLPKDMRETFEAMNGKFRDIDYGI